MLRARGRVARAMRATRSTETVGFTSSVGFIRGFRTSPASSDGKTPFQVFMNTFRSELKKSKELQTEIKALQDERGRLAESTAFKRAKEALDRSREAHTATQKGLRKAGSAVGTAASATWNSAPIKLTRDAMAKTADAVDKVSEPLRETEAYKSVRDVIDDGASIRYGGFESKEARHKRRQRDLERQRKLDELAGRLHGGKPIQANEQAGEALVVHATAKPDMAGRLRESAITRKLADWRIRFEESENGLIAAVRSITDTVGSWFGETESAQVQRAFKEMDPTFNEEMFLRELRGYILPEVLDAYVRGDSTVLENWLSEAAFNVWTQITKEYRDKGLYAAGRVLDVRNVDIIQGKLLQPADIPVFIVSARAQETNYYKSLKTDEVVAGIPDQILMSPYVMVITRVPENMHDDETRGWKILEFMRGRSTVYL